MQIGKILFPITSLGPGNRLGIWTRMCERGCEGCANPELWTRDEKSEMDTAALVGGIDFDRVEGVTISGGEPFLQAAELKTLVEELVARGVEDILVYSGFTMQELADKGDSQIDYILGNIAVLVDGAFEKDKTGNFPLKGSSNQQVRILKEQFRRVYEDYMTKGRELNIIRLSNGEVHFIGIPPDNYDELYADYMRLSRGRIIK